MLILLPLTFSDCLYESVYPYLPLPSTAFVLLPLFGLLTFLLSCLPPNLSSQSSSSVQLLWRGQCPCLPWPERSSGILYVASLSSSSRRSSNSVLFSPLPTVAVTLAPVSRGRQSAIGPLWCGELQRLQSDLWWLQDILRDDVRHVKSGLCRQERKCSKIKAFYRKTVMMD